MAGRTVVTGLILAIAVACCVLTVCCLVDLWAISEEPVMVRWSVVAIGSLLSLLFQGTYLAVCIGRADETGLRVRKLPALIASPCVLFVFVTPLFGFLADTLGTFAGLLIGLTMYLTSRFFGL